MLHGLIVAHGIPKHIRSENGPSLLRLACDCGWKSQALVRRRLRPEFPGCEILVDVQSAKALGTAWRVAYNQRRPHSSLGHMPQAEFARTCAAFTPATPALQQHTCLQTCLS